MDANAVEHLRSTFDRVLRSHSPAEGDPNLRPLTGLLLRNGSEILSVDSWQWRWRWKRRCPSPLRCIKAALFPVRCVFQWKGSLVLIVWGEKLVPDLFYLVRQCNLAPGKKSKFWRISSKRRTYTWLLRSVVLDGIDWFDALCGLSEFE